MFRHYFSQDTKRISIFKPSHYGQHRHSIPSPNRSKAAILTMVDIGGIGGVAVVAKLTAIGIQVR